MASAKRDVGYDPDTGQKFCFSGDDDGCIDTAFVVPEKENPNFDQQLADTTVLLQRVLDDVRKTNNDPRRSLAFINTPKGLLLAWVTPLITRRDGEDTLFKALGILNPDPLKDSGLKQSDG